MPLSPTLARWLTSQGHEAIHAADIGLQRAADTDIIEQARRDGRTVITADLDYPRLLALTGAAAPSLILFRGGNWSDADVIARLDQLLEGMAELDLEQSIVVIEQNRIRRRRLPIRTEDE